MIAVDTNVLVYAHRSDSEWHQAAAAALAALAEGHGHWAIPWPCIHEFLAVVTHPRIYAPPSTLEQAIAQVDAWLECPSLALIAEDVTYWDKLREQLRDGRIAGPRVHDARIAAICALHGVRELWSADRDFSRFPKLATKNPLLGEP